MKRILMLSMVIWGLLVLAGANEAPAANCGCGSGNSGFQLFKRPSWSRKSEPSTSQSSRPFNLFGSFTPYHPEDNYDRWGSGYGQVPYGGYPLGSNATYRSHFGYGPGIYFGGYYGVRGR